MLCPSCRHENPDRAKFCVGRLENTIGWVHQELGDFAGALQHDLLSADIGKQIKNGNVEISALINQGFDHLHLGEPAKASDNPRGRCPRSSARSPGLGRPAPRSTSPRRTRCAGTSPSLPVGRRRPSEISPRASPWRVASATPP
jgi:hypothetical protein